MPSTAEPIIAQVQQQFQELVAYVTGPETRTSTAYEVELTLFRRLLSLGAALLRLFFVSRAAVRPTAPIRSPDGTRLAYHDRRPTTYYSVFGKLVFHRHAFTAPGQPVLCPLDAALSLPARCYSDLLREWMSYGTTDEAYRETRGLLERILGRSLSLQALETTVAEDALDVAAFYEQPPDPRAPASTGTLLVAQADGKGVPLVLPAGPARPVRRGKGRPPATKEAVVTALYTIAPYPRTPEDVAAALLREADRPDPPTRRSRPRSGRRCCARRATTGATSPTCATTSIWRAAGRSAPGWSRAPAAIWSRTACSRPACAGRSPAPRRCSTCARCGSMRTGTPIGSSIAGGSMRAFTGPTPRRRPPWRTRRWTWRPDAGRPRILVALKSIHDLFTIAC